jgi:mono/diheme cytochrome c family protein
MKRLLTVTVVPLAMMLATPVFAGPREDLLAKYAAAAKSSGFSAARGQTLHTRNFAGGKPDTPACTSCHGKDPRGAGRTTTGKSIDAVAVSATPTRYSDPAKVEKWFKRNCNEVLGRECTPQEKGDWLTYVIGQ